MKLSVRLPPYLAVVSMCGCGYERDGQISSEGVWPLVSHSLGLPKFEFKMERPQHIHKGDIGRIQRPSFG